MNLSKSSNKLRPGLSISCALLILIQNHLTYNVIHAFTVQNRNVVINRQCIANGTKRASQSPLFPKSSVKASKSPLFRQKSILFASIEEIVLDKTKSKDEKEIGKFNSPPEIVEIEEKLIAEIASKAKADTEAKAALEGKPIIEEDMELLAEVMELEARNAVDSMIDETCEIDPKTGNSLEPEICEDEDSKEEIKSRFRRVIGKTLKLVGVVEDNDGLTDSLSVFDDDSSSSENLDGLSGERLEKGWETRGNSSAIRRNAEVWKFALKCVFKSLQPRKLKKKGASESEIEAAKTEAATFIRDGLLTLGPTFVKLGQVISTRTDVLPAEFIEVLKTLQDEVPGFSGARAKEIISREFGRPCDEIFTDFSETPLKAASLGQVHTAKYKGKDVAIKVQRAGLKELFDVDLKNLKKLAKLLDKFDPKSDGADRDWVGIYEESERLLYLEIDYLNEADNADRFRKDFKDTPWVRVPEVYREM